MTIQEAIKSGKRFKRADWTEKKWCAAWDPQYVSILYTGYSDVLATDWEIEIVKKELSAEDIRAANSEMLRTHGYGCTGDALNLLISKLGLE